LLLISCFGKQRKAKLDKALPLNVCRHFYRRKMAAVYFMFTFFNVISCCLLLVVSVPPPKVGRATNEMSIPLLECADSKFTSI